MAKSFYSSSWYRVADLKPRLADHIRLQRQQFRGALWYVLQEPLSQKYYRFSEAAYTIISLMDGTRSVADLFDHGSQTLGPSAPTQDQVIELLAQLHTADALRCDGVADLAFLSRRDGQTAQSWSQRLLNPFSWRFALFDPTRAIDRLLPLTRFFFSPTGASLWLTIITSALVLGASHWQDLTHDFTDTVLAPRNLLILWLLFPLLKIVHEFGHACALRFYGGEVPEMGIMLLFFQPLPYVNASSAAALPVKSQRLLVSAAGMMSELWFASLALFVWLNVEPGLVRTLAYNVIFVAGISTVVFNANPLMRYDGYYLLSDYLEIPNLSSRAQSYFRLICERHLLGEVDTAHEEVPFAERLWLMAYPLASWTYRLFVYFSLASFIASKFVYVGVIIALGTALINVVLPTLTYLTHLWTTAGQRRARRRAVLVTSSALIVLIAVTLWLPLPLRSRAEGVIWVPEQAQVRARADGFVEEMAARPGARVRKGDVLIVCRDPQLARQVKLLEYRLDELQTRYAAEWLQDLRQAQVIKDEIAHVEERLAHTRERLNDLTIRSQSDGILYIPQADSLIGRFVQQGAKLAYVLDFTALTVRVVVPQTEADLVRHRSREIAVRLADRVDQTLQAKLVREVPAASEQLPSTALGSQGGGAVLVDPTDAQGTKALQKIFQFDLSLPPMSFVRTMGGRVYVRFDHGAEPLVKRWSRQLRQLFLGKFDG